MLFFLVAAIDPTVRILCVGANVEI